ncbi:MAG: WD40 repeat domain-containing protein, partial [Muribaculaceae bacterium]|nr:WD40 repeat domain-containing protein [Muribaculaceae bacterium]
FAPGKYRIEESSAASAMLRIVKEAFEGDFAQYFKPGKKLLVKLSGTADATPIHRGIAYDGIYGEFIDEPVYQNGLLTGMTVTSKEGIRQNEQLAFIRACAVKNYLANNISNIDTMNTDYTHHIAVSEGKGGEFRRITAEFTFVDAF